MEQLVEQVESFIARRQVAADPDIDRKTVKAAQVVESRIDGDRIILCISFRHHLQRVARIGVLGSEAAAFAPYDAVVFKVTECDHAGAVDRDRHGRGVAAAVRRRIGDRVIPILRSGEGIGRAVLSLDDVDFFPVISDRDRAGSDHAAPVGYRCDRDRDVAADLDRHRICRRGELDLRPCRIQHRD